MDVNKLDLLDVLLDPDNKDPITLLDGNGQELEFEQICVLPIDNKLYCLLKPLFKIEELNGDEAIAFEVKANDEGVSYLEVVSDEEIEKQVFEEYNKEFEKARKKAGK